jgi:hypothetical protein
VLASQYRGNDGGEGREEVGGASHSGQSNDSLRAPVTFTRERRSEKVPEAYGADVLRPVMVLEKTRSETTHDGTTYNVRSGSTTRALDNA